MLTLQAACLTPPDGHVLPAPVNAPPVIHLDSVTPREPIINMTTDCDTFRLTVDQITDADDDKLVIRFVADINTPNDAHVIEPDRHSAPAREPQGVTLRAEPSDFVEYQAKRPHTLSILVTDAPRFEIPPTPTTAVDLGRIEADADGDGDDEYSVVEQRWVVNFIEGEKSCPPR